MTFLAIVIVLLLEWYFRVSAEYRTFRWFVTWRQLVQAQLFDFQHGMAGLLLVTATPVVVVLVLLNVGDHWMIRAADAVLAGALLWYCLGPRDLRSTLGAYFDALERGDHQSAWTHLRGVVAVEAVEDEAQMARRVSQYILTEINRRYIAVLFWFAVLGPAAALFYRLLSLYADMLRLEPGHVHHTPLKRIRQVLDWVPARLTALAFTLVGDFMRGYSVLHAFWKDANASSERILTDTGVAALALPQEPEGDAYDENVQVMALAERAMLFVVVLLALLSMAGLLI